MSTRVLHLDSPKIDKATSGAYYLLFNNGGHTGNLVLDGTAYLNYINASGLAVQNGLVVTGSQITHGNATFFNFNNSANLSVTGNAYINNLTGSTRFNDIYITGDSVISGDIGQYGNFNSTGTTNIRWSLYFNGVQITGVTTISYNVDFSLTGDAGAALTGRGDLLVGTGNSGVARFATGGAVSGQTLIFNPASVVPFRWGNAAVQPTTGELSYENTIANVGGVLETGIYRLRSFKRGGTIKRWEAEWVGGATGFGAIELMMFKNGSAAEVETTASFAGYDGSLWTSKVTSISVSAGDVVSLWINGVGSSPTAVGPLLVTTNFLPT